MGEGLFFFRAESYCILLLFDLSEKIFFECQQRKFVEPVITTITAAVTLGAAAGLKDTASKAVTDAYTGLKKLIQNRYNSTIKFFPLPFLASG